MLICIDSCVFIRAYDAPQSSASSLLRLIGPQLPVVVPRLVISDVVRNLRSVEQLKTFHRLFVSPSDVQVIGLPVPRNLIARYVSLGLSEKGDAVIGAFADWMQVDTLISDNRHFLRELQGSPFQVATPEAFLSSREQQSAP